MERDSGIHRPGAVLCDPSAAIALLWMRRTLQFLGSCLQGVVDNEPMADVGATAYRLELEPFHNWLLKQTCAASRWEAVPTVALLRTCSCCLT